jgi:hypothetical protein
LGIGDRPSEFFLDEPSYEAIVSVLRGKQFDHTRPFYAQPEAVDTLASAREEGPSLTQSFHETASQRGGKLTAIVNDICAFANTAGGVIYVGAGPRKTKPRGLLKPAEVQQEILAGLDERMTPPLELKCEIIQSQEVKILRLMIPKGPDRPYCVDDFKYYVRDEAETTVAVRDELVALVREALQSQQGQPDGRPLQESRRGRNGRPEANKADPAKPVSTRTDSSRGAQGNRKPRNSRAAEHPAYAAGVAPTGNANKPVVLVNRSVEPAEARADEDESDLPLLDGAPSGEFGSDDAFYLPQIGVEIVSTELRNGNRFHSIHDLRNGHVIHNVTRKGARKLWSYAIQQHEDNTISPTDIQWEGDAGLVHTERRAGKERYDLALRTEDGKVRIFYGVTEDGMEGRWANFVQEE